MRHSRIKGAEGGEKGDRPAGETRVEGRVEEIVFRNPDTGWTVLTLRAGREEVTVVGTLPFIEEGERIAAAGAWVDHPDYGTQLKAESYETLLPTTSAGIERYLSSGFISGIGPATARAIVTRFGSETLSVLELRPDRLTEVPGIGPSRARMIADSFQERMGMQKTMMFLQSHGITLAYAMRIWNAWGDGAPDILAQNPYRLCAEISGIGFIIADKIAFALGTTPDAPARIGAGVHYALSEAAAQDGHCYLPRAQLQERAGALLGLDQATVRNEIDGMAIAGTLVLRRIADEAGTAPSGGASGDEILYLPRIYEAEGEVTRRLTALLCSAHGAAAQHAERIIDAFEHRSGIELAAAQRAAIRTAARAGVSVITGGPGTGKTTIIKCLLDILQHDGQNALLCAPTGRAAQRLAEATGRKARTLHRLLEAGGDAFGRDEDHPLECDALIVDEMSMVDLTLMRALLRALPEGVRLVLVGDADQLPSVGAGDVLRDIIESGVLPIARLTDVYRQSEASQIVLSAHAVNRGEMPAFNARGGDFFLERRETAADALQALLDLCTRRLPAYLDIDPRQVQVLTPMKKGELGTHNLNARLQAALNPPDARKPEIRFADRIFRLGDKVMQVKNNYQIEWVRAENTPREERGMGIYNGDIGGICAVDAEERTLSVAFDEDRVVVYDAAMADDLEPAYAVTIHKSQGSEFPCAVIPVVSGPPMLLTRNLLYTAITRARRLCVLVGRESTVAAMIDNNRIDERYTQLAPRLRSLAEAMKE